MRNRGTGQPSSRSAMIRRYLFALGLLAVLSIVSFSIMQESIGAQETNAAVVNTGGRQRMLSQRIAHFSLLLVTSEDPAERGNIREELLGAIGLMEKSHDGLINGDLSMHLPGNPSPQVRALYFQPPTNVDSRVRQYLAEAKAMADAPDADLTQDNPHLSNIRTASEGELLNALDAVVKQYQVEAEADTARHQQTETAVLGATLSVLVMTGLFVFRPMVRRVQLEMGELKARGEEDVKKLSNAIEQSADSMVITDRNGIIEYVNPAFEKTTGYTKENVLGNTPRVVKSGKHEQLFYEKMWETILSGKVFHAVVINKKKSGELYYEEKNISPLKDSQGNITHFVSTGRDITESQRAQEALRESEEKYRDMFQTVGVPIWENDYIELKSAIDGLKAQGVQDFRKYLDEHLDFLRKAPYMVRVVDVNDAALKAHDAKTKEELLGPLGKVVPPEALGAFRDEIIAIAEGKTRYEDERVNLTAKGDRIDILLKVAFPSETAKFNRVLASYFDVTERRRAEEALLESEERYRTMFQTAAVSIWEQDDSAIKVAIEDLKARGVKDFRKYIDKHPDFLQKAMQLMKVVDVNEETLRMYGAKHKEELLGPLKGIPPEAMPAFGEQIIAIAEGKSFLEDERVNQTLQGERKHVLFRMAIPAETGKFKNVLVSTIDITERKRAEDEKLAVMSRVARSVGHDMRNPLTAIRSAAYILRGKLREEDQKMLDLIDNNVTRADMMVLNLVDFSTELKLSLSEADLNSLIQETLSQLAAPENVKTTTKLGDIPKVWVDVEKLKRVLSNLYSNALQAMPHGGELANSTTRTENFIEIAVGDTGVGISKENIENLFTPFFTTKAKGMGLGLINAKRAIEAHGGTIQIDSEEAKGTTVTVKLPLDLPKISTT